MGGGLLSDRYFEDAKPPGLFGKPRYTPIDLNTSSLKARRCRLCTMRAAGAELALAVSDMRLCLCLREKECLCVT